MRAGHVFISHGLAGGEIHDTQWPVAKVRGNILHQHQTAALPGKAVEDQQRAVARTWAEAVKDARNWATDEAPARTVRARDAVEASLNKLLRPAQRTRFEQVLLQQVRIVAGFGRGPGSRAPSAALPAPGIPSGTRGARAALT